MLVRYVCNVISTQREEQQRISKVTPTCPQASGVYIVRAAGRTFCYVLLALSCVLFVLSLFNECYFFDRAGEKKSGSGLLLLLIGWLGVFQGIFAWLANPFLLVGWFLLVGRLPRAAAVCAFAATVCAGSFLLYKTILTDEAGNHSKITGYGMGYWLWLASAVALLAASFVAVIGSRNHAGAESANPNPQSVFKTRQV
jgi:hypothetical protein